MKAIMGGQKQVNIMGTRGIPAAHGGFETFAERLSEYLLAQGWKVLIYCQADCPQAHGGQQWQDQWQGITRHHIAPRRTGAFGTIEFDFHATRHVLTQPGVDLVLGYNTALFNLKQSLANRPMVINMDGIEWQRDKWSWPVKLWFFLNEAIGANFCGTMIADHPEIAAHLMRRSLKIPAMVPYGADRIKAAPSDILNRLSVQPDDYMLIIARIEPENSILELVEAFVRSKISLRCVILGQMDENNTYHRAVRAAANRQVIFAGAIYDRQSVAGLRFYARAYLHGHTVGGTNPSLVEALGAGNAVLAKDNKFNRWTAGKEQFYFTDIASCVIQMQKIAKDDEAVDYARQASRARHADAFDWDKVLAAYEALLSSTLSESLNCQQL